MSHELIIVTIRYQGRRVRWFDREAGGGAEVLTHRAL
jgi:hypothetical protein